MSHFYLFFSFYLKFILLLPTSDLQLITLIRMRILMFVVK